MRWLLLVPLLEARAAPQRLAVFVRPEGRILRTELPRPQGPAEEEARDGASLLADDAGHAEVSTEAGGLQTPDCHKAIEASDIPEGQACPPQCPFWAEDGRASGSCYFKCVKESECGNYESKVDTNASVADHQEKYCRRCRVGGCIRCARHMDECVECGPGYTLAAGACESSLRRAKWFSILLVVITMVYFACWYCDLLCRPVVNKEGVREGLRLRSLCKLRMPKQPQSEPSGAATSTRPLWPLSTNLLHSAAGGPGLALHFRFQVFVILWAVGVLLLWTIFAAAKDTQLFSLGWKKIRTPRDMCHVVHWGYELQKDTLEVKIAFLAATYALEFVACIAFAAMQLRFFQQLDDHTTMKDFAALVVGVPQLPGTEPVEDMMRELLAVETGETVVGVSMCWDFSSQALAVAAALDEGVLQREAALTSNSSAPPPAPSTATEQPTEPTEPTEPLREVQPTQDVRKRLFGPVDRFFLDSGAQAAGTVEPLGEEGTVELLRGLQCTNYGFVVFQTEQARDAAVRALGEKGGVRYHGSQLQLQQLSAEPDTVRWEAFTVHDREVPKTMVLASLAILLALVLWTALFYLPYVLYMTSFSFQDEASQPSGAVNLIMTFVVVAGNLVMYTVCASVSEWVGFHFEDDREAAYMVMYSLAVFINVGLDMSLTGYLSYKTMVGAGAHTYGGKHLKDLDSFQEIFESYPMQKSLGFQLFYYCFPSCFLLPFFMEPAFAIALPFHLSRLVLRSRSGVAGHRAERSLAALLVMDMGRYADLLINITLSALVFFAPGGFVAPTFGVLVFSHLYIYCYDHYRVLRCVPGFCYATSTIDSYAQRLLAIPCGITLGCLAFKVNEHHCKSGDFCLRGDLLSLLCIDLFVGHVALHWALLTYLVPRLGRQDAARSDLSFEHLAERLPSTWFSANPVHCLRSRFFYKHSPPCSYWIRGKEHLMQKNAKALSFFEDGIPDTEDYK